MIALIAQIQNVAGDKDKIFGKIEITGGPSRLYNQPVGESIATLFVFGIRIAFVVAAILVLLYMLWGAFDYITSGGEPEKTTNARGKIVNAFLGIILLIVVFTIWVFITEVFGIIKRTERGFTIQLPTLQNPGGSGGSGGSGSGGSGGGKPGDPRQPI